MRHPNNMISGALAMTAALVLSACGSSGGTAAPEAAGTTTRAVTAGPSDTSPSGQGSSSGEEALPSGGASPLPTVDVVNVASGETVALASLLPADKPLLVWMWAPH
jgi:hypothetical protein